MKTTLEGAQFEAERADLERLAYRMLGSRVEAEDIVQDTFVRWQQSGTTPDNVGAWLTRTCVRLCLDRLKSAQRQRENYVGPWLPEPWVEADDSISTELDETISIALLALLERLNPAERAAVILHDVFDYEFSEVAGILGKSPDNCRQLASRARKHLRRDRARASVDTEEYRRVAGSFFTALRSGDLAELRAVLAEDVVLRSDGGGKAIAARRPVEGADKVALFLARTFVASDYVDVRELWFNGAPGLVVYERHRPVSAFQVEVVDGVVAGIAVLRNPDKLVAFAEAVPH